MIRWRPGVMRATYSAHVLWRPRRSPRSPNNSGRRGAARTRPRRPVGTARTRALHSGHRLALRDPGCHDAGGCDWLSRNKYPSHNGIGHTTKNKYSIIENKFTDHRNRTRPTPVSFHSITNFRRQGPGPPRSTGRSIPPVRRPRIPHRRSRSSTQCRTGACRGWPPVPVPRGRIRSRWAGR